VDTQAAPLCLSHHSPDSSARRKAPVLLHACVVQIHWLVPALSVLLHAGASPSLGPPPHGCSAAGLPPHPLSTRHRSSACSERSTVGHRPPPSTHRRSSSSSKHEPPVVDLLSVQHRRSFSSVRAVLWIHPGGAHAPRVDPRLTCFLWRRKRIQRKGERGGALLFYEEHCACWRQTVSRSVKIAYRLNWR
jgi:hypothetical protein